MKRNRRLLAIVVSSAVALPMAALQADEGEDMMEVEPHSHPATYDHDHAMEDGSMSPMHAHEHESHPHSELHGHTANLYGSIRTGIVMSNPEGEGDTSWDIGNTEDTNTSRIGVKASLPLPGGMTAGVHIEKSLGTWTTRLQNAYLSGDFGKLTIGQQWGTFYNATSIDGAFFLGGNIDGSTGYRSNGIQFSSSLGGPFNFSAMVKDNDTDDEADEVTGEDDDFRGEGVDIVEVSGTLSVAGAALSVGWQDVDKGNETIRVRAAGSFGPLGYKVGGGTIEAPDDGAGADVDVFGAYLSFAATDGGVAYIEYEDLDSDTAADDNNYFLVGYAQTLAPGVQVVAEFATPDVGADSGTVVLKVDF